MAQDDVGDKTEQPTPRRREEAREEGQVPRSMDLTAAVSLVAGLLLLKVLGPRMLEAFGRMTRALGHTPDVRAAGVVPWIREIIGETVSAVLPFLLFLMLLTMAGTAVQSGLVFTWKKLAIKPDKLNPVNGLKRMFSGDSLARLVTGLMKVSLIGLVAWLTIQSRMDDVLSAGTLPVGGVFSLSMHLLFDLALRMALVLLVLGIIDYMYQRWKLERDLRMTKQEVRDEMKRMEGDPLLKQRRRRMQQRLAMQRINAEVPKADVVVTNPTEYSVAIKYDQEAMDAPRVVAKGKDYLALRIRQLAQQHGVPVVQRPPLARGLYAAVDVGQEIPPAFYQAVAEVLAYVYQLARKVAG